MSTVRWSDLNDDSSSVSSASSDNQPKHSHQKQTSHKQQEIPKFKKIQSSPPQYQKKSVREQKISEELEKLKTHKNEKVWLYVLDGSKNDPKVVNDILENNDDIEKKIDMRKGWNIFMRTDKAAQYLEKGIKQRGIQVKLIYSKKNQEPQGSNRRLNKFEKSPKRAYFSPNSQYIEPKSPRYKPKKEYLQKGNEEKPWESRKNDEKPRENKKKPKYVARDNIPQNPPSKDQDKDSQHKQSFDREEQRKKQVSLQEVLEPSHNIFKKEEEQIKEKQETKNEKDNKKNQLSSDSDSSEQIQKIKKERAKKKNKKKKKGGKNDNHHNHSNNPFSALCG